MTTVVPALLFVLGFAYGSVADLEKVNVCNGQLTSRPLTEKNPEELQFYMQTVAQNEQECVSMCYERLNFCYSAMYKPKPDEDGGICFFSYYRPDSCETEADSSSTTAERPDRNVQGSSKFKAFTCIRCQENQPSFVQDLDENQLGPAKLIRPATADGKTQSVSGSTERPVGDFPLKNLLVLRESKAFSYLMPKCNGHLVYRVQPTLMNRKPKIYAATNQAHSIDDCAHFCYRQHFCASAFYQNDNCLLTYQTLDCENQTALPANYTGTVIISCMQCKKN